MISYHMLHCTASLAAASALHSSLRPAIDLVSAHLLDACWAGLFRCSYPILPLLFACSASSAAAHRRAQTMQQPSSSPRPQKELEIPGIFTSEHVSLDDASVPAADARPPVVKYTYVTLAGFYPAEAPC